MKSLLLLVLFVSFVLSAPTPPVLETNFISNFTLGIPDLNTSGISFPYHGYIAVDYKHGGGFFELKGAGIVPVYIETNFVAVPNVNKSIEMYWFADDFCWGNFSANFNDINLFPLEVPHRATYLGQQTVNKQLCSVWNWESTLKFYDANITMWVDVKLSTIVQIEMINVEVFNVVQWSFENTIVGHIDPAIYSKPDLDCVEPPIEESVLDNFALYNLLFGWEKNL